MADALLASININTLTMKKYFLPLAITIGLFSFSISEVTARDSFNPATFMADDQSDERKEEINPRDLPEEARMDIVDNYHNAKILKAYKLLRNGKFVGYLVDVQKGPKNWTIKYDVDGNPLNKINPIKS